MVSSSESFLLYSSTSGTRSTMAAAPTAVATAVADTAHPSAPAPKPIPGGDLLSLNFDELSQILGGSGRAKMVWSALSTGVDPFGDAAEFLTDKTAAVLKDTVERLPWQVWYACAAQQQQQQRLFEM